MRLKLLSAYMIFSLIGLLSCQNSKTKCEYVQEWKVQNYRIVKSRCPDYVLALYYRYDIYTGDKLIGGVNAQADSCLFTWQAEKESFITFNICNNTIQEIKPQKVLLETKSIDSIIIFSKEFSKTQSLTPSQTGGFVKDWNNSTIRGYSQEPFDSSFSVFPAYQYRLTIFSKGKIRYFYGYNFLILDSSNWEYEMSNNKDLGYFHKYWKR